MKILGAIDKCEVKAANDELKKIMENIGHTTYTSLCKINSLGLTNSDDTLCHGDKPRVFADVDVKMTSLKFITDPYKYGCGSLFEKKMSQGVTSAFKMRGGGDGN